MKNINQKHGIAGHQALEFNDFNWIDRNGGDIPSVKLADFEGKFKVIYCFQSWCPGCHSVGLPSLQKMINALKGNDNVAFLAIQTVFEGKEANTFDKLLETQNKYNLKIPFGHDEGDENSNFSSSTMQKYRSGGTPWFILIDQENRIVFNDFHLNTENAIEFLQKIKSKDGAEA